MAHGAGPLLRIAVNLKSFKETKKRCPGIWDRGKFDVLAEPSKLLAIPGATLVFELPTPETQTFMGPDMSTGCMGARRDSAAQSI